MMVGVCVYKSKRIRLFILSSIPIKLNVKKINTPKNYVVFVKKSNGEQNYKLSTNKSSKWY